MTFLVLVFWLCFKPFFVRDERVQVPNRVLLLLDDSFSMTLDSGFQGTQGQTISRADFIRDNILGKHGLASQLQRRGFQCQIRSLSTGSVLQDENEYMENAPITAIGEALRDGIARTEDLDTDKIVLVTDGCNNAGEDPLNVVQTARVPVFALGMGQTDQPTDVAVTGFVVPERVFRGQEVGIHIELESSSDVDCATVLLSTEGNVISSATTPIRQGKAAIDFETSFEIEGVVLLKAEVVPIPGESLTTNNTSERAIHVTRQLTRGLIVWGHPDWEFRFLTRALRQDKRLAVTTACAMDGRQTIVVRTAVEQDGTSDRTDSERLMVPVSQVIREETRQGLDWVLLGNLPASDLGAQGLDTIAHWVSESGGNLFVTGGPKSFAAGGYSGTALEKILPVVLSGQSDYQTGQPAIELTDAGREHLPFAAVASNPLPPLSGANSFQALKPGTDVLFSVAQAAEISPSIVTGRSGLGRVLVFGGYGTWAWQMYPSKTQSLEMGTSDIHGRFWRSFVDYFSAEPGSSTVAIETDKSVYEQGSEAQVWVAMPPSILGASPEPQIRMNVQDPEGETDSLVLGLRGAEGGIYTGRYRLRKAGVHVIEFPWAGKTSTREITAEPARLEYAQLVQNEAMLRSLAQATGGAYFTGLQWERLLESIPLTHKSVRQRRFVLVGQQPWLFGLLLGLLAAEWILRRRVGLP